MIAAGTFMMIEKKDVGIVTNTSRAWLPYAAASAVFAALTSILGKVGISGVESNLGTMIRTIVVFYSFSGRHVFGLPGSGIICCGNPRHPLLKREGPHESGL